jgi:murein DD-endopeptidase MepM/ murein hydrolase activator NlpD
MRSISVLVAGLLVAGAQAAATPSQWLTPPVDAPIVRHFAAPTSQYGPGHRGVDYGVSQGTRVRAAGSGVVTFAGVVAGVTAVTINHGGGVSSTYTRLQAVEVVRGQHVTRGGYIGVAGEAHPGEAGLHFGVKVDGAYVDPESMLGPIGAAEAIHLAPTGRTQASRPRILM